MVVSMQPQHARTPLRDYDDTIPCNLEYPNETFATHLLSSLLWLIPLLLATKYFFYFIYSLNLQGREYNVHTMSDGCTMDKFIIGDSTLSYFK